MDSKHIITKQRLEEAPPINVYRRNSTMKVGTKRKPKSGTKKKRERFIAGISIILIVAAWFFGKYRENTDIEPFLYQAMPNVEHLEKTANGNFAAYIEEQLIGYVTVGEGSGYGGPIQIAVATDMKGKIKGLAVVRHIETPSFFDRVDKNGLISRLVGMRYGDGFNIEQDIDGVSGATYTSRGIAKAVMSGSRDIAKEELSLAIPLQASAEIKFGIPEVILLVLFSVGTIGRKFSSRHTKKMRWFSMLTGMIVLGFIYTSPMTISLINKMLIGFWPDWHTHLYWYMLLIGIVFSLTATKKNPYCEWFCPFGAAQECIGKVGGAKAHPIRRYQSQFVWLQRGIALLAILIALVYRNPGISSYEIFGTLFDLEGNIPQFFLLGLVILASLFIHRPWCRYLCPLKPVEAFINLINDWTKDLWQNVRREKKTQQ